MISRPPFCLCCLCSMSHWQSRSDVTLGRRMGSHAQLWSLIYSENVAQMMLPRGHQDITNNNCLCHLNTDREPALCYPEQQTGCVHPPLSGVWVNAANAPREGGRCGRPWCSATMALVCSRSGGGGTVWWLKTHTAPMTSICVRTFIDIINPVPQNLMES